ncbi:unnamed protein product [Nippostrongylus brasiliensis]|uniref:MFS domain-containing protein n=1 Tax=Nippostrongylus brasiliensis TaxID=27835 RepID=A0A0N4Y256_NIPBR|nr:unnamed protein product [Nippostrongylus brasiliensis]
MHILLTEYDDLLNMLSENLDVEQRTALATEEEMPSKGGLKIPGFRYIVLITAALCLTSLLSNMNTFNFTKICMVSSNATAEEKKTGEYDKTQNSWLQACVAVGALTASFPYTYMFEHYTKKWVFLSAGIISAAAFMLWIFLYKDKPYDHPLVGIEEQKKLQQGKAVKKKNVGSIPYKKILMSKPLIGAWIAAIGDLLAVQASVHAFQLVNMFTPQYLNDYLHYNVLKTGFLAALPVSVQFMLKLVGGVSSDQLTCIGETNKLRIYNSMALGGSAVFFAILAFVPRESHVFAMVILVFAESLLGLNTAGFNKCATLHSRQYSHFVMTQIMNIWAVTILIEPFLVQAIVAQNDFASWRNCFLFHTVALLFTNAVFCVWADANPAPWTNVVADSDEGDAKAGEPTEDDGEAPTSD